MSDERNELERQKAKRQNEGKPHKEINRQINEMMSDEELRATIQSREREGKDAADLRNERERRAFSDD